MECSKLYADASINTFTTQQCVFNTCVVVIVNVNVSISFWILQNKWLSAEPQAELHEDYSVENVAVPEVFQISIEIWGVKDTIIYEKAD